MKIDVQNEPTFHITASLYELQLLVALLGGMAGGHSMKLENASDDMFEKLAAALREVDAPRIFSVKGSVRLNEVEG